MYELKVVTDFAAAHQLKLVGRKCENLHGHNWKVEVVVQGETLDNSGVLMDFGEIKRRVAEIRTVLDHRFLNEIEVFDNDTPPSSENISRFIAHRLQESLEDQTKVRVSRVTVWESADASATYFMPLH